ncbi:MAG: Serine/threonine protein kinaserelated protein [Myxococcaceae bacterium]|nr:Serine/threonine protein kinaserelated protein [Myxococcaceae bacterium]
MKSERVQKRQSVLPAASSERLRASASERPTRSLGMRLRASLPLWLGVLGLACMAGYAGMVVHGQIERGVADELRLILAAEIEVAHVLITQAERLAQQAPDHAPPRRLSAAEEFGRVLARLPVLSRVGRSGETYAFDKQAVMLTPSRFADELREQDLLLQRDGKAVVELRDPGGHVAAGHRPALPRERQPLTKLAASAIAGHDGVDVDGYRDYRGVKVVGAWRWLPQYGLGVAVEIDAQEAFALNQGLRRALSALALAMLLALIAVGGSTGLYARARTELEHARQLGQYTLVRELGRGGMGTVYEARHALLRRPTAVKLMNPYPGEALGDTRAETEALLRFEREVQLTSQLSHPNTVVVYDYGRSADGILYYAMEYIDGVDLDYLVRVDGALPAARVIHFAQQICGSLAEAHDQSLIHRDIKPANILVCARGGVPDFIKVLDFGLVKSLLGPQVSGAHVMVGTPQFMAPEVLRDPAAADPRSDIYALGAVLYWLTTGRHVFTEGSRLEALSGGARIAPPSSLSAELPLDLERVIMRCLAREPHLRPLSMTELAAELRACRVPEAWSEQDARRYWRERGSLLQRDRPAPPDVPTVAAS